MPIYEIFNIGYEERVCWEGGNEACREVSGGGRIFLSKEKSNNLDNGQTNPSHYFFIGCRTAKVVMSSGDFGVTFKEDKGIFLKFPNSL